MRGDSIYSYLCAASLIELADGDIDKEASIATYFQMRSSLTF